jgi:hypothetical protein
VAGSSECGDEPSGSSATELVGLQFTVILQLLAQITHCGRAIIER